jgi:predicted Zn finger-like uncharacterized protein
MIISCIKCQKKFSVDDKLIPELGRILECGSCLHQWHYIPVLLINKNIDTNKTEGIIKNDEPVIFDKKTNEKKIIPDVDNNNNKNSIPNFENDNVQVEPVNVNAQVEPVNDNVQVEPVIENKKKKSNFLNKLLVIIITFVAVIIILDTFRDQLLSIFPSLDLYLNSLYNVINDIFLFVANLIK